MTATITWSVTAMDAYPQAEGQTDVVFNCHWTCAGVQDTYQASVYSTCGVTYSSGTPYTPYAQLTQDQVLSWIWASGVDKAATEAAVQAQLNNLANPPVVTPKLPWITA